MVFLPGTYILSRHLQEFPETNKQNAINYSSSKYLNYSTEMYLYSSPPEYHVLRNLTFSNTWNFH